AIQSINDGFTHYPPVAGYLELKKAITEKFQRENNLTYQPNQVVVSTGAKQSIINIILSIVEKGDEVLVPSPFWVSYPEMIKMAEATPVFIKANIDNDYKITPEQLEAAITPKTKAVIYSSPSNPTGSYYTEDELRSLAEVFQRHTHVYVISDEIYEHINFTGKHTSIAQLPGMYERTIVVNGVSKAFAMTGWRIGYMAGPEWIAKACEKLQGQFTSGASSISQRATLAALTSSLEPTYKMRDAFKERRDLVMKKMERLYNCKYNVPQGAFYLFPDVSCYFGKSYNGKTVSNAEDLSMYLLEEARVTVVSGAGFGCDSCIRISFAASKEDLSTALDRIADALEKLS
ncbi:MAG: pyridoxal phosphate-dependent aminotransferase, partial [Bacteroidia bacterium]